VNGRRSTLLLVTIVVTLVVCSAPSTPRYHPSDLAAIELRPADAPKGLGYVAQFSGDQDLNAFARDDAERARALDAGHDLSRVLTTDDLVTSDDAFFAATGITDGELMAGVRYRSGGATTESLVMRARSGTLRNIHSEHQLWKLNAYSAVNFAGD